MRFRQPFVVSTAVPQPYIKCHAILVAMCLTSCESKWPHNDCHVGLVVTQGRAVNLRSNVVVAT
jgi:hypothetical protein